MTAILTAVPTAVRANEIISERTKLLFWKVFWYAITVKSIGQKVTLPLFAAAFPLKDIAKRFKSGRKHKSANVHKKMVLKTTNIFLLKDALRMIIPPFLEYSVTSKFVCQLVRNCG